MGLDGCGRFLAYPGEAGGRQLLGSRRRAGPRDEVLTSMTWPGARQRRTLAMLPQAPPCGAGVHPAPHLPGEGRRFQSGRPH